MTRLEHAVLIDQPLAGIYALCRQVERYPDFLPGYRESKIVARRGDAFLLERAALVLGRLYRWTSWVRFEENQAIHFEQAEGPLRGMRVEWRFEPVSLSQTRVVITHHFHVRRPWGMGLFLEHFIFTPKINAIAGQVVAALKQVCESHPPEVVPI